MSEDLLDLSATKSSMSSILAKTSQSDLNWLEVLPLLLLKLTLFLLSNGFPLFLDCNLVLDGAPSEIKNNSP